MTDLEGFGNPIPEKRPEPIAPDLSAPPGHTGDTLGEPIQHVDPGTAPGSWGTDQEPEESSDHDSAVPGWTAQPDLYPSDDIESAPASDSPEPEVELAESGQAEPGTWETRIPQTVNLDASDVGDGATVIGAVGRDVKVEFKGELLRHWEIPVDDLEGDARDRFVPPAGIEEIEESLHLGNRQVALLAIEEGGRDTTARYLASAGKIQTPRSIDPPKKLRIEPWQLKECRKSGWLLDLTDTKIEEPKQVFQRFLGLRDALRQQESFLIVVVGERDLDQSLREELGVIVLKRPDPYAVFKNQLPAELQARASGEETAGAAVRQDWVKFAKDQHLLDQKSPSEALRLARTITEVTEHWQGLGSTEREALKEELHKNANVARSEIDGSYVRYFVLKQFQVWEPELDAWNRNIKDKPRLRTFQLAVAVVPSGDPVKVRTEATALLGRIIKRHRALTGSTETGAISPVVADAALNGPGTRQLAMDSMAELRNGKVTFTRPGFDEAVVRYFWDDWPEYRGELIDWLMGLANSNAFSDNEQNQLKERISTYAIHHAQDRGEFNFLYDVIAKWAESTDTLAYAAALLEDAANAPGIGRRVRDRTLDWAKKGNLALKRVVAKLCARSSFANSHPTLAVKRLSSLMENRSAADQDDPLLENSLQTACRVLVTETNQTSTVLSWLDKDLQSKEVKHRRRAALLFLPIAEARSEDADPPALITQIQSSEDLRTAAARSWGTVLRLVSAVKTDPELHLGLDQVQPVYNAWVNACESVEVGTQVADLFRDAVRFDTDEAGDAAQHGAILTYRWHEHSPLSTDQTERIQHRLHAAFSEGSGQALARSHQAAQRESM